MIRVILFIICIGGLVACLDIGMKREEQRQIEVNKYNCIHFSEAMNKWAGYEICPIVKAG
jgi:hypothetical protein